MDPRFKLPLWWWLGVILAAILMWAYLHLVPWN